MTRKDKGDTIIMEDGIMLIVKEAMKNVSEEMFTSVNVSGCETDAASCGCGN